MTDNVIKIQNLTFGYGNELLHKGINMNFKKGKVSAIMGGSGSGKTTILKLIGGQIKPKSGSILVENKIVHEQNRSGIYKLDVRWECCFSTAHYLPIYQFMKMLHFQ